MATGISSLNVDLSTICFYLKFRSSGIWRWLPCQGLFTFCSFTDNLKGGGGAERRKLCPASPFPDLFAFGMETEEYGGILITIIASSFESLWQCLPSRARGSVNNSAINTVVSP
jgi:hypothetical protein